LSPRIVLVARREKDLQGARTDCSIWSGEQRVGRIYRKCRSGWFRGINSVDCDMTVGVPTQGFDATSFGMREIGFARPSITGSRGRGRSRAAT
jgi:hypothetical protein